MTNDMKSEMTFDEMAAAFVKENPWFKPNYTNVGRFAKKHGYTKIKQMVNKVIVMRYVKK